MQKIAPPLASPSRGGLPWPGNLNMHPVDIVQSSNTLATWWEELTPRKRLWRWERLRAGGEGSNRRWDSWMVSPTQWTWFWANSGRWWRTGKPAAVHGVIKSQTWLSDWTTYVIGFDLISMDEFENNRWFASGGYAKYHHMFANFISGRNINNFYLPEEISTTSDM